MLPKNWMSFAKKNKLVAAAGILVFVMAVLPVFGQAACVSPPPGLIGWWPGEGNASDIKGSNHGISNGATFAAGKVGSAFGFNGVYSYVQVADSPSLDITDAITIETWIKLNAYTPGAHQAIVSKLGGRTVERSYAMFLNGDGTLYFGTAGSPGTGATWVVGPLIPLDQWVHVAGVKDPGSTSARIYVNGALAASGTVEHPPYNSAASLGIGVYVLGFDGWPNEGYFNGAIDEASIYNRTLTASEIQSIFDAGSEGKCKPAVATATPTLTPTTTATITPAPNMTATTTTTTTPTPTLAPTSTPTPTTTASQIVTPTQKPTFTPTVTATPTATRTPTPTPAPTTTLAATQTPSPTPVNRQTEQQIRDLEEQVKKLKEQQAQQERKISWFDSILNSLWRLFGSIFGWTAPPEPVVYVTPTPTFIPTTTPEVITETPTETPEPTPIETVEVAPTETPEQTQTVETTETPELIPTETPTVTTPDAVLFSDDFSGGFPGKNWIYTGGGGTPTVDSSTGNPAPSVFMPGLKLVPTPTGGGEGGPIFVGSGQSNLIELRSATNPFNTAGGFEISADVSTDIKSRFTFSITNQNEDRIYATATLTEGYVTYEIRTAYNTGKSATNPVMKDSDFHKFTFRVDADGNAKWLRDGVQQFSHSIFPAGDYIISFKATGGTTYTAQYATTGSYVDNVNVTSLMQTASSKTTSTSGTTGTGSGGGGTTSTIGTLSVSDDNGNLYVGGSYIGRGSAVVSLYAGSYTLSAYSPSTGELCWQRSIRIDGGKTTLVKIDTYCR